MKKIAGKTALILVLAVLLRLRKNMKRKVTLPKAPYFLSPQEITLKNRIPV